MTPLFNAGPAAIASPRAPAAAQRLRHMPTTGNAPPTPPPMMNLLARTLTFLFSLALHTMLIGTCLLASAIAVDELLAQPALAQRAGEFASRLRGGPAACAPAAAERGRTTGTPAAAQTPVH